MAKRITAVRKDEYAGNFRVIAVEVDSAGTNLPEDRVVYEGTSAPEADRAMERTQDEMYAAPKVAMPDAGQLAALAR